MNDYRKYFKDCRIPSDIVKCKNDWYCLIIPMVYRDGDYVEIFVRRIEDGTFQLSDDGDLFGTHSVFGDKDKMITKMLNSGNLSYKNGELTSTATEENLAQRVISMASSMIATDYLSHMNLGR